MTKFHYFRAETVDFLLLVCFVPSRKFSSSVSILIAWAKKMKYHLHAETKSGEPNRKRLSLATTFFLFRWFLSFINFVWTTKALP